MKKVYNCFEDIKNDALEEGAMFAEYIENKSVKFCKYDWYHAYVIHYHINPNGVWITKDNTWFQFKGSEEDRIAWRELYKERHEKRQSSSEYGIYLHLKRKTNPYRMLEL